MHLLSHYPPDCEGEDKGEGKVLYCSTGASKCEVPVEGCICNTYPLYYEYNLHDIYYCDKEEVGESKTIMRKMFKGEDHDSYEKIVEIKDKSSGISVVTSMGSTKKVPFTPMIYTSYQLNLNKYH